jgi:hypothetical protein
MVHAGIYPGVNVTMQPPTGPQSLNTSTTMGYLPPVQPATPPSAISGPLQGKEITGEIFSMSTENSGPLPVPPNTSDEPPVDAARQRAELEALKQGGFTPAGGGQVSPRYDGQGQPIAGSKEWVLQVTQPRSAGYLTIAFYCPAGYPAYAPRVQMRSPAGGGWTWVEPNSVQHWNPGRTLLEVAQEIARSLPPS